MRTLEKINTIKLSVNCTYKEARKALTIGNGNIPKAIEYIKTIYNRMEK